MKKIGIITLTRQNSLAYACLKKIVLNLGCEPVCGEAIGSEALFLPLEELHLVGYDFLGPFFQKAGFSDVDCILISAPYTVNLFSLPKVIRSLRAVSPAPIVLGGNEASNNYRNLMEYRFIPFVNALVDVGPDFIVRGAAEQALPVLLPLVDKETRMRPWTAKYFKKLLDVPNLVFWVPERSALVSTRLSFQDLPEKEIFSVVKYGETSAAVTFQRACVWARKSRGGCLFCAIATQFGETFHCSVKTGFFIEELTAFIKNNEKVENIDIWDDTFNADDSWTTRICELLKKVNQRTGNQVAYSCFLRPKGITSHLTDRFKAANIKAAFVGADAVTQDLSRRLRRGCSVRELDQSLEVLSRAGISYNISVQLFSPESTLEDVEKTAELALRFIKGKRSKVHVHLYTFPLFGSAIHSLLAVRNNLKSIPSPLMRRAGDAGFKSLPVAYDFRSYDPEVETIKQKTFRLLNIEASFFVRTYPGDTLDAGRLKEVLSQVRSWCLEVQKSHPAKSLWYLTLLFLEGGGTGLTEEQMMDLFSRNEPASAIPEPLRKTHGDFGHRYTLSRSFADVMGSLLKAGRVRETGEARYTLTLEGESYLFSVLKEQVSNSISVAAYARIHKETLMKAQGNHRPLLRIHTP